MANQDHRSDAREVGGYRLLERTAPGSSVFRAEHVASGRKVAIKRFRETTGSDSRATLPVCAPGHPRSLLSHGHIVEVIDRLESADEFLGEVTVCLVTEWLDGMDLGRALAEYTRVSLQETLRIFISMADALEYACDQGICHHRVAPNKIFLCSDGTAKLLDFAIMPPDAARGTHSPQLQGTIEYLAPELMLDDAGFQGDTRSDIFSLGTCLYETVTGRRPFTHAGESPQARLVNFALWAREQIDHTISFKDDAFRRAPELPELIDRCLSRDRSARYDNFRAVKQALDRILQKVEEDERPETPTQMSPKLGSYKLIKRIEVPSSFAYIWIAEHEDTPDKPVVLKLLREECHEPDLIAQFADEGKILNSLKGCAQVVDYIDYFSVQDGYGRDQYCLVLEYLGEHSLFKVLEDTPEGVPLFQALCMMRDVAKGLAFAHGLATPIIHRDIKPDNILCVGPTRAKLIDFGIAHEFGGSRLTEAGIKGSWDYIAPDYVRYTDFHGDAASDIYSFAVCLYRTVTGALPMPPLEGTDLAKIMSFYERSKTMDLSHIDWSHPAFNECPELRPLIETCMDPDGEKRCQVMNDIVTAIDDIIQGLQAGRFPGFSVVHEEADAVFAVCQSGTTDDMAVTGVAETVVLLPLNSPEQKQRALQLSDSRLDHLVHVPKSIITSPMDDSVWAVIPCPEGWDRSGKRNPHRVTALTDTVTHQFGITHPGDALQCVITVLDGICQMHGKKVWHDALGAATIRLEGDRVYFTDPSLDVPGESGSDPFKNDLRAVAMTLITALAPADRIPDLMPAYVDCEIPAGDAFFAPPGVGSAGLCGHVPELGRLFIRMLQGRVDAAEALSSVRGIHKELSRQLGVVIGDDRYELIRKLDEGGCGTVFLVRSLKNGGRYAAKRPKLAIDASRFAQEMKVMQALEHPNITRFEEAFIDTDIFSHSQRPYLIMEYLEGVSLRTMIRRRRDGDASVSDLDVVGYFRGFLDAIAHCHDSTIVHRDIKPGNLFITDDGTPKLLDFGIARDMRGTRTMGRVPGTFEYMAPEFVHSDDSFRGDERSDIFSLGICLYETLTGRKPYAEHLPDLRQGAKACYDAFVKRCESMADDGSAWFPTDALPPPLVSVIQAAIYADPARRYATVSEFNDALRASRDELQKTPPSKTGNAVSHPADTAARPAPEPAGEATPVTPRTAPLQATASTARHELAAAVTIASPAGSDDGAVADLNRDKTMPDDTDKGVRGPRRNWFTRAAAAAIFLALAAALCMLHPGTRERVMQKAVAMDPWQKRVERTITRAEQAMTADTLIDLHRNFSALLPDSPTYIDRLFRRPARYLEAGTRLYSDTLPQRIEQIIGDIETLPGLSHLKGILKQLDNPEINNGRDAFSKLIDRRSVVVFKEQINAHGAGLLELSVWRKDSHQEMPDLKTQFDKLCFRRVEQLPLENLVDSELDQLWQLIMTLEPGAKEQSDVMQMGRKIMFLHMPRLKATEINETEAALRTLNSMAESIDRVTSDGKLSIDVSAEIDAEIRAHAARILREGKLPGAHDMPALLKRLRALNREPVKDWTAWQTGMNRTMDALMKMSTAGWPDSWLDAEEGGWPDFLPDQFPPALQAKKQLDLMLEKNGPLHLRLSQELAPQVLKDVRNSDLKSLTAFTDTVDALFTTTRPDPPRWLRLFKPKMTADLRPVAEHFLATWTISSKAHSWDDMGDPDLVQDMLRGDPEIKGGLERYRSEHAAMKKIRPLWEAAIDGIVKHDYNRAAAALRAFTEGWSGSEYHERITAALAALSAMSKRVDAPLSVHASGLKTVRDMLRAVGTTDAAVRARRADVEQWMTLAKSVIDDIADYGNDTANIGKLEGVYAAYAPVRTRIDAVWDSIVTRFLDQLDADDADIISLYKNLPPLPDHGLATHRGRLMREGTRLTNEFLSRIRQTGPVAKREGHLEKISRQIPAQTRGLLSEGQLAAVRNALADQRTMMIVQAPDYDTRQWNLEIADKPVDAGKQVTFKGLIPNSRILVKWRRPGPGKFTKSEHIAFTGGSGYVLDPPRAARKRRLIWQWSPNVSASTKRLVPAVTFRRAGTNRWALISKDGAMVKSAWHYEVRAELPGYASWTGMAGVQDGEDVPYAVLVPTLMPAKRTLVWYWADKVRTRYRDLKPIPEIWADASNSWMPIEKELVVPEKTYSIRIRFREKEFRTQELTITVPIGDTPFQIDVAQPDISADLKAMLRKLADADSRDILLAIEGCYLYPRNQDLDRVGAQNGQPPKAARPLRAPNLRFPWGFVEDVDRGDSLVWMRTTLDERFVWLNLWKHGAADPAKLTAALGALAERVRKTANHDPEFLRQVDYAVAVLSWKGRGHKASLPEVPKTLNAFPPYRRFTVYQRFEPASKTNLNAADYREFRKCLEAVRKNQRWAWLFNDGDKKLLQYLDKRLSAQ